MNIRKFFANSSRQALRQVRESLGPDALIVSNRPLDGGVEILALAKQDLPSATGAGPAGTPGKNEPCGRAATAAVPAGAAARADPFAQRLVSEILSMRGLLEEQIAYQALDTVQRRDPAMAKVLRDLLRVGFSPELARQFLVRTATGSDSGDGTRWVKAVLERNLRTAASDEVIEQGGVYALVGPTGVGKTTTTAKIAARCVVRHGADRLALLTTDSYRIGAHEQLRIYGKLLGVRVHAIKDAPDLQFTLADLRNKHLVLIDTVGMSQRDQLVAEQLAMLASAGQEVRRLLLLGANGNGATLDDVVRAYRSDGIWGCVLTKIDEAVGLATVLDVAIRHKLVIQYVANGQRVPENLHLPDRRYLLDRALRPDGGLPSPQLDDDECRLLLAGAGAAAAPDLGPRHA